MFRSIFCGRNRLPVTQPYPKIVRGLLAGVIGFEPMNMGTKIPCLTAWLNPIERYLRKAKFISAFANGISWTRTMDTRLIRPPLLPTELRKQKRGHVDLHHEVQPALLYPILFQTMTGCHPVHGADLGISLRAKVLLLTWSVTHRPMLFYIIPANSPCQSRTGVFAVKGQWLSRLPNGPYEDTP